MNEAKKTVVVTGGSRGIGAGIARLFGARGWHVVLTYVSNEAAAEGVVGDISAAGGSARAVRCDTRHEADIKALFSGLRAAGTLPDALVNNAGVTGPKTRLEDLSLDTLREVVDVNLVGL